MIVEERHHKLIRKSGKARKSSRPIPVGDFERVGFPESGGGQVVDPPLGEARRRIHLISSGASHPGEGQRRRDFMDAVEDTFQEEVIAVLSQLCLSLLYSSYIFSLTIAPLSFSLSLCFCISG